MAKFLDLDSAQVIKEYVDTSSSNLQDEIDNLKGLGRFLALWNSTTGLPTTNPPIMPYTYKTGDYYIISQVGETNYKPNGTVYDGTASTTAESNTIMVYDYYLFDGTTWSLLQNTQRTTSFSNIVGSYSDNSSLNTKFTSVDSALSTLIQPNAGSHNGIFRGKNITSYWTDGTIHKRIQGTDGYTLFEDLFVGDYFTASINGTNFTCRLAGFDIYWNNGDTALQTHHAVIVCDETFTRNVYMNSTNTTAGGYEGSYMHRTTIPTWNTHLANTFGANLITNRELLCSAVSSGVPSSWAWFDCKARLMNEIEVYGAPVWGKTASGTGYNIGAAKTQLPLFRLAPQFINPNRYWWWLSDVVSATAFAFVDDNGGADTAYAGYSNSRGGLRPRFLIK